VKSGPHPAVMSSLRITIGGVRGIVGETLTPGLIVRYSHALATWLEGGKVFVSRDTRRSGEMVLNCAATGLIAAGCQVVDLGICTTAALQLAVKHSDAAGGLAITAGHNIASWNALKSVRADGMFLNPVQAAELLDIYHQGEFLKAQWDGLRPLERDTEAGLRHLDAITEQLDVEAISRSGLRVAVDCANGACSAYAPRLLEMLGLETMAMNTEVELPFPHPPEPSRANLSQLRALVRAAGADVGFAFDADGDRLGLVCHDGEAPGEEMTICLATDMILSRGDAGPVITNLSTTQAVGDIARRHGREVIRTPIGQAHIAEAAANHAAAVAGEGSGGVVFPRINYAQDSLACMGHLLESMARSEKTLAQLVAAVPVYHMVKEVVKCPTERAFSVLESLRRQGRPSGTEYEDLQDGIKYGTGDRWVHIRVSMTEPIIRVIAEARRRETAEDLVRFYVSEIRRRM
jgi:phosphomannomutase